MEDILAFAKKNGNGFLATVDQGKPRLRGWGFMFFEKDRFYFCTSNKKMYTNNYQMFLTQNGQQWINQGILLESLAM